MNTIEHERCQMRSIPFLYVAVFTVCYLINSCILTVSHEAEYAENDEAAEDGRGAVAERDDDSIAI